MGRKLAARHDAGSVYALRMILLLYTGMRLKRQIASWVLLAVFVPKTILSSIHIHHTGTDSDVDCTQCVDHHCSGHLSQQHDGVHQCVLCQFLTLPLAVATAVAVTFVSPSAIRAAVGHGACHIIYRGERANCLRAPPVLFFQ